MATLDEIKENINQLRLQHSNSLTRLETLVGPIPEQLEKIQSSIKSLEKSHTALAEIQAEHKGVIIGAKWMIGVGLAILTVCGGTVGAVVSHVLSNPK